MLRRRHSQWQQQGLQERYPFCEECEPARISPQFCRGRVSSILLWALLSCALVTTMEIVTSCSLPPFPFCAEPCVRCGIRVAPGWSWHAHHLWWPALCSDMPERVQLPRPAQGAHALHLWQCQEPRSRTSVHPPTDPPSLGNSVFSSPCLVLSPNSFVTLCKSQVCLLVKRTMVPRVGQHVPASHLPSRDLLGLHHLLVGRW